MTDEDEEARHAEGVSRLTTSLASAGLLVDDEIRLDLVRPGSTVRVSRLTVVVDDDPPVVGFVAVATPSGGEPLLTTTSLVVSHAGPGEGRLALDPPAVGGGRVTVSATPSRRAAYEGATNPEVARYLALHESLGPAALTVLGAVVTELERRDLDSVSAVLHRSEQGGVAERSDVLAATALLEGVASGAPAEWVTRRLDSRR